MQTFCVRSSCHPYLFADIADSWTRWFRRFNGFPWPKLSTCAFYVCTLISEVTQPGDPRSWKCKYVAERLGSHLTAVTSRVQILAWACWWESTNIETIVHVYFHTRFVLRNLLILTLSSTICQVGSTIQLDELHSLSAANHTIGIKM